MDKNGQLFNSRNEPIPRLRPELDIILVQQNGDSYLFFHDMLGYATENFALNRQAAPLLSMLDGQKSIEDLTPYLGNNVTPEQLLEYIQYLDRHHLLHSSNFRKHAEAVEEQYQSAEVHQSVTAGSSYPADPDKLKNFLDEAFGKHETVDSKKDTGTARALYAPHIDPRVGLENYVKAFSAIRELKPRRVVILATSHYAGMNPKLYQNRPYIVSRKDFEMPLGTIKNDRKSVGSLKEKPEKFGVSGAERAHRIEHSIELHLLFLSYLWDHDYEIIPILVGGFDDLYYMEDGHLGKQVENFASYLNETYAGDEDTFFLISGDLAHIGKKFGDRKPAAEMFNEVRSFDRMFMNHAEKGDTESLLGLMKEQYDPYRICGFPPLYTFLKVMPGVSGSVLSYDLWDESERESAVSFGSILYSKK